ncbi:MAG: magnesium transporter [Gammaproteobacteria bacterium]|nr:magnesium transporter [Gammaproteobacteria bacterium]
MASTAPAPEPDTLARAALSETAAQHMVERVPTGSAQATVGAILGDLAADSFGSVNAVYVLDNRKRLLGVVPMATLLGAGMQTALTNLMVPPATTVSPEDDQEKVAAAAVDYGISDVPVTDARGRLLGIVPARALLRIQRGEHIEDIDRLAGILRNDQQARAALEGGRFANASRRLPWLLLGLAGGALATWVMAAFEAELQRRITVAFFVPAIVYLAGAVGTQSVAIAVRGLSLSQLNLRALTTSELLTGVIIGVVLAGLAFPAIVFFLGDLQLAIAVCLALVVASALSTTIGLLLPWFIWKGGGDPALGSGPVATILQDILSLLAYFGIVAWLL